VICALLDRASACGEAGSFYQSRAALRYEHTENYAEALADAQHADLLKPCNAQLRLLASRILHALGRATAANEELAIARRLDPEYIRDTPQ